MLYIGFHDTHRCDGAPKQKKYGEFCEKFGDGVSGQGVIPDWKPVFYKPEDVMVPPYLPDTPSTRADIAAMYTGYSRLDQGTWNVSECRGHFNTSCSQIFGFPPCCLSYHVLSFRFPLKVYDLLKA